MNAASKPVGHTYILLSFTKADAADIVAAGQGRVGFSVMRNQTSSEFEAYARTLRRVFWSEFLDRQMGHIETTAAAVETQSSAPSLAVYPPLPNNGTLRR